MLQLEVICLCHQYRDMPAWCTAMQSVQTAFSCLANFKFSSWYLLIDNGQLQDSKNGTWSCHCSACIELLDIIRLTHYVCFCCRVMKTGYDTSQTGKSTTERSRLYEMDDLQLLNLCISRYIHSLIHKYTVKPVLKY